MLTGSEDGTARIWEERTGVELATLVTGLDGEWVTITPEGFFDASENGAKLLSVVQGLDVYSVDQF